MSQFQHTLFYDDHAQLIAELERLLEKLYAEVEQADYYAVRDRYPHLSAGAFAMRLQRFEAAGETFPHTKTKGGGRLETIFVTRALDRCLGLPLMRGRKKAR